MNKLAVSSLGCLSLVLAGCATAPSFTLPIVDVSKLDSGRALTATEIKAAVSGKQMTGTVTTGAGYVVQRVLYVYEADGTLHGANPNDWDKGKWHVNQKGELCASWTRWQRGCATAAVRNGKLHLFNPATSGQYQQQ